MMDYHSYHMARSRVNSDDAAGVERLRVEARTSARLDSLTRKFEDMDLRLATIEERTSARALTESMGVLEARLASLERSVREPKMRTKDRLTRDEWLAQRREVMKENFKHRWSKKAEPAPQIQAPAPKKRKAPKR